MYRKNRYKKVWYGSGFLKWKELDVKPIIEHDCNQAQWNLQSGCWREDQVGTKPCADLWKLVHFCPFSHFCHRRWKKICYHEFVSNVVGAGACVENFANCAEPLTCSNRQYLEGTASEPRQENRHPSTFKTILTNVRALNWLQPNFKKKKKLYLLRSII